MALILCYENGIRRCISVPDAIVPPSPWEVSSIFGKTPTVEADSFPFLKLPAELRNEIYSTLLYSRKPVSMERVLSSPSIPADYDKTKQLKENFKSSILLVSREVHNEAISVLFRIRQFLVHVSAKKGNYILHRLSTATKPSPLSQVCNVTFEYQFCCLDHNAHWKDTLLLAMMAMTEPCRHQNLKLVIEDTSTKGLIRRFFKLFWPKDERSIFTVTSQTTLSGMKQMLTDCREEEETA